MKARDVAVQGVLAGVALVAAFFVWQREPSRAAGEVTVEDAQVRSLDRVRYEDEARFVELFRDAQDRDAIWVRLGSKPAKPKVEPVGADAGVDGGDVDALVRAAPDAGPSDAGEGARIADATSRANAASDAGPARASDAGALATAGADAGTPSTPAPVPPPRELRGNDLAQKLFAKFAPLRAQRELGVLDAKKLEELGLAKTERALTLTVDSTPKTFRLAAPASGWGAPYLQRPSDSHVFLLGPALLSDLEAASSRLVDRRLHTFDVDGFDRVVITAGTTSRAFVASGQPPGAVQLSPVDAPGTPDDFTRNWHDRVWRLTPLEFLGRGESPPGLASTPAFRIEYQRAGKPVGELSMAMATDHTWYARTEFTPGWTRMGGGLESLAEEAAKLTAPPR
ncbi:hypothetical protein OV208_20835 [Corallococcus sp. bb12-1]|uniref:hypothetical protein n=1 Tax=Corallococcus sp. bb12-1 TaxID=2996784 RepID=UPI002271C934|nr:hypothetical protein [Corallococcus sp. bb12-1]MCY1043778.1 hypothetical protein [Corallococcus sp. bb12-1]